MKRILFYMLFVFACSAQAQNLVEIPDSNFRKALKSYHLNIFVGSKVNSQLVDTISSIDVSSWSIESLDGIQFFKNLKSLKCGNNQLTSLPTLPSSLTYLECNYNQLTSLPALPSGLIYLDCLQNQLISLPTLPSGLTTLYSSDNQLTSLPLLPSGLFYFGCASNKLTSLPALPSSIKTFTCMNNHLTSLPALPSSLTLLECSYNQLTILPALPGGLNYLNCVQNKLTNLPELPADLIYLYCNTNKLTSLPELPGSLTDLYCSANQLTSLPALPRGLTLLGCSNNNLSSLPVLPVGLTFLGCSSNQLTSLPDLPNKLTSFECSSNQLIRLPILPSDLTFLNCSSNKLTSLPRLTDNLIELYVDSNYSLSCLPILPSNLRILSTSNTTIKCISNKPSGFYTGIPICNPTFNQNGCEVLSVISGVVFNDNNKNGIKENDEFPRKGVKVIIQPSGQYAFTNNVGYYEIAVDSLKTYTVSIEIPTNFSVANQTLTPTFIGEHITKDFALKATKDIKDLSATLTPLTSFARPGFSLPLVFEVENRGTSTENGTAYVDFPSDYILDSTSINSVNGNFNFTNLHPGESIKMMVYGRLATTATLGDTLKIKGIVNIYDSGTDSVYSNNISEVKMPIRGSFDPNDKQGPKTVTPKQVQNGEFIEYIIRFQNTGTDTAFTVVVADTLTANLSPETLEMISTSHNCKTTVKGNQVYFEFLNILLPDSNTNEVKSHGYVRFKVKPINTLKLGQSILNTASIYFDYNKPIVTNTVNTKVDEPLLTTIQTVSISSNGIAFPNPVENGRLFVSNSKGLKFKLNNAQGQLMMNGTVDETGLDVSQLNQGMYMLEIGASENRKVEKIVIR